VQRSVLNSPMTSSADRTDLDPEIWGLRRRLGRRSGTQIMRGYLRALSATLIHPIAMVVRMGRPKIYAEPRIATAIRLPTSLRDELISAASERDVSVNYLVTRAVTDYLKRLPAISSGESSRPRTRRQRSTARVSS
jgi:hypothetical protein